MAGFDFDKGVMAKLLLSLLAVAIAATCLLSGPADEAVRGGRTRGGGRRSLLLGRRKPRGHHARKAAASSSSSGLHYFVDPKSVAPRVAHAAETSDGEQWLTADVDAPGGGAAAAATHIEGPFFVDRFFPFTVAEGREGGCVSRKFVEDLSGALRRLIQNDIRVFPRNGFLLGIVRHGGFLPHEHVGFDLGIVHEDLDALVDPYATRTFEAAGFYFKVRYTETGWRRWFGMDPTTGEPYPFFGVNIGERVRSGGINLRANSVYRYGNSGNRYFYPWVTKNDHAASVADALRYNHEGGNLRIVDGDERVTSYNAEAVAQWGNVFKTDLTCFVEVQFYHTTIPIPCDYDEILTSFYGNRWTRVESRGGVDRDNWPDPPLESLPLARKEEESLLGGGPWPMCSY